MEEPHFHFNNLFWSGITYLMQITKLFDLSDLVYFKGLINNKGVLDLDKILSSLYLRSSFSFPMYN